MEFTLMVINAAGAVGSSILAYDILKNIMSQKYLANKAVSAMFLVPTTTIAIVCFSNLLGG